MVDAGQILLRGGQWLAFDVKAALTEWQKKPRRNYGIVVEVENEEMTKLKADDFVRAMNCSEEGRRIRSMDCGPKISSFFFTISYNACFSAVIFQSP